MQYLTSYPNGIHTLDAGYRRPMLDAIHLVVEKGRVALVDPATNTAVPRVLAALATLGLAISAYLSWTKLNGIIPPCLPGGGCETVASSPYSAVAGVPVAVFGVGYSAVVLALALGWWRSGQRRDSAGATRHDRRRTLGGQGRQRERRAVGA